MQISRKTDLDTDMFAHGNRKKKRYSILSYSSPANRHSGRDAAACPGLLPGQHTPIFSSSSRIACWGALVQAADPSSTGGINFRNGDKRDKKDASREMLICGWWNWLGCFLGKIRKKRRELLLWDFVEFVCCPRREI